MKLFNNTAYKFVNSPFMRYQQPQKILLWTNSYSKKFSEWKFRKIGNTYIHRQIIEEHVLEQGRIFLNTLYNIFDRCIADV